MLEGEGVWGFISESEEKRNLKGRTSSVTPSDAPEQQGFTPV
jgi:hypothetical protein